MIPEVTASDILSYKGDPGLAAGAGNGGILPQQGNPFQGMQDTLARAQEEEAQMRVLKYQERIKQQNKLAEDLAKTGDSVFNMRGPNGQNVSFAPLPDDKKILDEKADELNKAMTSNPGGYRFDPKVLALQREIGQLNAHAQTRAVAVSRFNQDAASSNDEDERTSIQEQMKNEIFNHPLQDFHTPTPHVPHLTFDPETFISSKDLSSDKNRNTYQVNAGTDAAGNIVQKSYEGLNDNALDFRTKVVPGSKDYSQAVNMANSYLRTTAGNPAAIQAHNANIDAINKARGYIDAEGNPISPHYIPHVADVVQSLDGSTHVVLKTKNPADIAYSVMAERYGALQQAQELKKTALEARKDELSEVKTKVDIAHTEKIISQMDQELEIKRKNAEKEGKALTPQQVADEQASIKTVARVGEVFNPAIYQGFGTPIVKSVTNDKAGKEVVEMRTVDKVDVGEAIKAKGLDPKDYGVFSLPDKADIKDAIGVERRVTKENGAEEKTGESVQADKVLALKNNKTGQIQLAFFQKGKKDDYTLISLVNGREAVGNAARHKHEFKGEKLNDEINRNEYLWDNKVQPSMPAQAAQSPAAANDNSGDDDEQAKIMARLRPAKVKKPDGTVVEILYDPVTKKRYAKN